jgi:hypothetical protein
MSIKNLINADKNARENVELRKQVEELTTQLKDALNLLADALRPKPVEKVIYKTFGGTNGQTSGQ